MREKDRTGREIDLCEVNLADLAVTLVFVKEERHHDQDNENDPADPYSRKWSESVVTAATAKCSAEISRKGLSFASRVRLSIKRSAADGRPDFRTPKPE